MRCFLSYNKADKELARSISAHMALTGIEPWFDEWEIQAGDSIPGKLDDALLAFDAFVLVWSANASRSDWVRQELRSAVMRCMSDNSAKIIPCLLDQTLLPPLISDRRGVDFSNLKKVLRSCLETSRAHVHVDKGFWRYRLHLMKWMWNGSRIRHYLRWYAARSAARRKPWNHGSRWTTKEGTVMPVFNVRTVAGLMAVRFSPCTTMVLGS